MRTTYTQPPNMKGKKSYSFRCGCCTARDCRDEYFEAEAVAEIREYVR